MSGLRGFLVGTLAVASTQAVLSTPAASGRLGSLAEQTGRLIDRFLDPNVPAIGPPGVPGSIGGGPWGGPSAVGPPPTGAGPDAAPGAKPPDPNGPFGPTAYPRSTKARPPRPVTA